MRSVELLEEMSQQTANLRKILAVQEDKMSKAGMLVESHADLLDRMFWAELPESSKKKTLLSEDAACVPARNVRQYVELLLQRQRSRNGFGGPVKLCRSR